MGNRYGPPPGLPSETFSARTVRGAAFEVNRKVFLQNRTDGAAGVARLWQRLLRHGNTGRIPEKQRNRHSRRNWAEQVNQAKLSRFATKLTDNAEIERGQISIPIFKESRCTGRSSPTHDMSVAFAVCLACISAACCLAQKREAQFESAAELYKEGNPGDFEKLRSDIEKLAGEYTEQSSPEDATDDRATDDDLSDHDA